MQNRIGIIVQARTGSTRLPGKVLLPFFENKSILDIIIERLKSTGLDLIVATSNKSGDDAIVNACKKHCINFFRGSENDVLQRFIDAAINFNINTIIRVCADNPFIQPDSIITLIEEFKNLAPSPDYLSFKFKNNKPSILTHFGFYGELVNLSALKRTAKETGDKLYHEHVTNYIYINNNKYIVKFINAPEKIFNREDIRLTIDSNEDFINAKYLYEKMKGDYSIPGILNTLETEPELVKSMTNQLIKYKK